MNAIKWICYLYFILSPVLVNAQWEWQNPLPQGNTLNDVFFLNQDMGWAVGELGIIIRTLDGGETFEVLKSNVQENLNSVEFFTSQHGFVVGDNGTILETDNGVIDKYCYDNNEANCDTYGGLYQWNEAMQYVTTEGAKGICPDGWHIPTYSEFETLNDAVTDDGNSLKALGEGSDFGAGTNTSGFSALLAGNREEEGGFYVPGYSAFFWSSTAYSTSTSIRQHLNNIDENIDLLIDIKELGFSIRCLED